MKKKLIHSLMASLIVSSVGLASANASDFIIDGTKLQENSTTVGTDSMVNIDTTSQGSLKEKADDDIILSVLVNAQYKDVTIKSGNGDINFLQVTTNNGQSLYTSTNKADGSIIFKEGLTASGNITATSTKTINIEKDATISNTGALNLTSGGTVNTKNITNNNNLSITSKTLTTDALTTGGTGKTAITSDTINLNQDANIDSEVTITSKTINGQNLNVQNKGVLDIKGDNITFKVVNNAKDLSITGNASVTLDELKDSINANNTYVAAKNLTIKGETTLSNAEMFIIAGNEANFEDKVKVNHPSEKPTLTIKTKKANIKKGILMEIGGNMIVEVPHENKEDVGIKLDDDVVVSGTKEDTATNTAGMKAKLDLKGNLLGTAGKSILAKNNGVINVSDFKLSGDSNDPSANLFKVDTGGTVNIASQEGSKLYADVEAGGSEFDSAINVNLNGFWFGKAKSNGGVANVNINSGGVWLGEVDSAAGTRENVRTTLNGGVFAPKTGTTTLPNVAGTGTFYLSDGNKENVMWSKKDDGTLDIITTASSNYTVENLVKDGSITFVARDNTTANPDKLTIGKVVNLENDAFKEDTTKALTNHKLLLVGDNKKLQEDFKNSPNKEYLIYTYNAPAENQVFKNSSINLAGGFKKPRFVIEEDAVNKGTFNVKVVGFTRRDLSIALFKNANALYDNQVAGKFVNDTYTKREELTKGQDGIFVRLNKNSGKDNDFYTSSGNTFDLGYNKNARDNAYGVYLSVSKDKLNYLGEVEGKTTLKSRDIVAYYTDKKDDAYLDYTLRFGKTKTKVDAKDTWDKVNGEYSQNRLGASVEYGKNLNLNDKVEITPQVQLALTHVSAGKLPAYDGHIDYTSYNSLLGRVGLDAKYRASDKLNVVTSLNFYHEFMGSQSLKEVEDSNVNYLEKVKLGRSFAGLGLGLNYNSGNFTTYARAEKLLGKNRNNNAQFNFGLKYNF